MKPKKWTSAEKFQIILEGIKGSIGVAQLCQKYGVGQTQYYKWRDQFFNQGNTLFETIPSKALDRVKLENKQLKMMIGELTIELKKTEKELVWLDS